MNMPTDNRECARRLLAIDRATLATLDGAGWPYASLVLVATDLAGRPLLLLSDLAEHTKNIKRDPRASLLFIGAADGAAPLAGPRLTLLGEMIPAAEPEALARYIARHDTARSWSSLADFHLYRMAPRRAHLVAGFGRIAWLEACELF
jgi:heme oxygenase (biliverdin-IX-beta and delta-forming)